MLRSLLLALLLAALPALPARNVPAPAPTNPANPANPDAPCAACHRAIYNSYEPTPMRLASGPAPLGLIPGAFFHPPSGIRYTLSLRDGQAWLHYQRPNAPPGQYLNGDQQLLYFVGSGTRGRTYLFHQQGWWFEAPVNWYAKKRLWDMPPNYLNARTMPFTLPVDPNCLHCHASDVAPSLPGSRNHFAAAPFAQSGVTCAACHGDASAHLRSTGKIPVVNPAALAPVQRDSVCLQCHLEGVISVYKLGHSLAQFHPGQSLFDDVTYFVRKGEIGPGGRATSQWEALLASKCKQASGDRLTCTTCHDPHRSLAPSLVPDDERIRFYRDKCLACHSQPKFRTAHHTDQPDCAACHMPRRATQDIAHEQVTDHRIQIPRATPTPAAPPSPELVPIPGQSATDRSLGLAYAQRAQHGDRASGQSALLLLRKAEALAATNPAPATPATLATPATTSTRPAPAAPASASPTPDPELHTELGFLDQMSGDAQAAAREYRLALAANPDDSTAAGDLAVLLARAGNYAAAVPLWQKAFAEDPTQTAAGFNLAVGECALGHPNEAAAALQRVLTFSPDDPRARDLAAAIASGRQPCSP